MLLDSNELHLQPIAHVPARVWMLLNRVKAHLQPIVLVMDHVGKAPCVLPSADMTFGCTQQF